MSEEVLQDMPMWETRLVSGNTWEVTSSQSFLDGSLIGFYVVVQDQSFTISDHGDFAFIAATLYGDVDEKLFQQINSLHPNALATFIDGEVRVDWVSGRSPYPDFAEALRFGLQDALCLVMHFSFKCREIRFCEKMRHA